LNKAFYIILFSALLTIVSCSEKKEEVQKNDPQSVAMLAGIWVNADDEGIAFKAKGDTLYYPEKDILPIHFRIYGDSIYLDGATPMRYYIEKLTQNIFQFRNQNGESVKVVKSNDVELEKAFQDQVNSIENEEIIQELIKRDTIVTTADKRYHCYVQINPTSYKVLKTDYNNEGVGVNKVYFDNIINLAVYEGARKIFSSDFHKQDFKKFVPEESLEHSILSDIAYDHCDESGVVFGASLRVPDSASGYIVFVTISPEGKISFSQPK